MVTPTRSNQTPRDALPAGVRKLVIEALQARCPINPGLRLDKYIRPTETMEDQRFALEDMRMAGPFADGTLLSELLARRSAALASLGAVQWERTAQDSVALHLARASSLENAGICLHPVYGFAYLPGTGLKGLARAYAETVWCPAQDNPREAWAVIENVFGWGAETNKEKRWKPEGAGVHGDGDADQSGCVVFHDAWPLRWPQLQLDATTPHHKEYYDSHGETAPGDWDSPNPVTFLALRPGARYSFAVSPMRRRGTPELVNLARGWLDAALTHLGAGAKTAAGYGRFLPEGTAVAVLPGHSRARRTCELKLVTPAFLAGADQGDAAQCRLRGATLRGLLRWWWRTMHAGYLSNQDLARLEKAIWGGTAEKSAAADHGSAVSLSLRVVQQTVPQRFNKREIAQRWRLKPPDRTRGVASQGLAYLTYGMDEKSRGEQRQRYYLPAGAAWSLTLIARASVIDGVEIPATETLQQAESALWLLTHLGGLGSKGRKGFGCLTQEDGALPFNQVQSRIARIRAEAAALRDRLGFRGPFRAEEAYPASLDSMAGFVELPLPGTEPWYALDQLGAAVQMFAAKFANEEAKLALGLPRRIGWKEKSRRLLARHGDRHAAPVQYGVFQRDGKYFVRVTAFCAPALPSFGESRRFLEAFVKHLCSELPRLSAAGAPRVSSPSPTHKPSPRLSSSGLKPGELVTGRLNMERTRKGGWKATEMGSNLVGVIQNTRAVPENAKAGDIVTLKVKIGEPGKAAFEFVRMGAAS